MPILSIEVSLFLCTGIISQRRLTDSMRCTVGRVLTIDDLPDDDFLAIFDFCVFRSQYPGFLPLDDFDIKRKIESWQSLVHVCRRWRCLVFGSARRLNLRLLCVARMTARRSLDVWPALPLIILGRRVDDVIPELEHSDRISQIELSCIATTPGEANKIWTAMRMPFPELVTLSMSLLSGPNEPALPDSFLGGSAPRLRHLALVAVPFPGLPNLLLSATHLVHLHLYSIPPSGYISPEAMVNCLSLLASLEELHFHFPPQPSPDQESRRPLPPTRSVLPALTEFGFEGINEYFEDFVSRIDAPRLYRLSMMLFDDTDFAQFDTPELKQFISRTPRFGAYNEAHLIFHSYKAQVRLQSHPEQSDNPGMVQVSILCQGPVRQLSFLARICTSSLRLLLTVDNLYFEVDRFATLFSTDGLENADWLNILLPFTAVKNLYLSEAYWPRIAPALQDLTGRRITEVLPALQNIFLEEFPMECVQKDIAEFISARQLANHPVAISGWNRD